MVIDDRAVLEGRLAERTNRFRAAETRRIVLQSECVALKGEFAVAMDAEAEAGEAMVAAQLALADCIGGEEGHELRRLARQSERPLRVLRREVRKILRGAR